MEPSGFGIEGVGRSSLQIAQARHGAPDRSNTISDMHAAFNDLAGLQLDTGVELVAPESQTTSAQPPHSGRGAHS